MYRLQMFLLSFLSVFLFLFPLNAVVYGTMPGGDPYKAWEDGSQDFFVMFNSTIDNFVTFHGENPDNPQGDTCIDESSFTLTEDHIPKDAIIEEAILVWMGAVDPSKLDDPTDNSVHFQFVQTEDTSVSIADQISVGEPGEGKLLSDENSFEFESVVFTDNVVNGCTPASSGSQAPNQTLAYFTYRKDITGFFNSIYEKNREVKEDLDNVNLEESIYYGTYTLSDLECTEHDNYRCITTMVSAWAVFFVYRSQNIRSKKIYLYNGLSWVQGDVSVATVSGFELPKDPVVRLTTVVAEGDPFLYDPLLPPEGIFLKGEGATSKFRLSNKCNPITGNYVATFNQVSSLVHWDPDKEDNITCVSFEDEWLNYGIDADTFFLDSQKNVNLQEHLRRGNTSMEIELSVNQDAILTNFMVLSVDNRGSNFDIPPEASDPSKSDLNFPYDREKHFCGCPLSTLEGQASDYWCYDDGRQGREFYYFIKVQNWGDEDTGEVRVWDELDPQLEYVPGTTEYATNYVPETDKFDDWTEIKDKSGGAFPLSGDGVVVSPRMRNCDESTWSCQDTVLIRYKVRPRPGVPKNYVFRNIANIKDQNDDMPYRTNRSYPLLLSPAQCVRDTECPSPTPEMCGGTNIPKECGEPGLPECGPGLVCEDYECVDDPATTCTNTVANFDKGRNSPLDMIVPKDNDGMYLNVGQFTVQANNCEENMYYNIDAITVNIDAGNDQRFKFTDLELFHDVNGNGVVDDGDILLATASDEARSVKFFLKDNKKFKGRINHHFIIRTKIDYTGDEILRNTKFNFLIESPSAIEVSDLGTAMTTGSPIDFASFTLEPTGDYFIITRGANDPPVPNIEKMNDNIPVLQIRTKALSKPNELTRMSIRVPGNYVRFGEEHGIEEISLFIDTNGDGEGNIKIAELSDFNTVTTSVIFENFTQKLTYAPYEMKYFVIYAKFNMVDVGEGESPMAARIEIPTGGIRLSDTSPTPVELPIRSKEFIYECRPGDPGCDLPPDSSKKGCDCSVISFESSDVSKLLGFLIAFFTALLLGRGVIFSRLRRHRWSSKT